MLKYGYLHQIQIPAKTAHNNANNYNVFKFLTRQHFLVNLLAAVLFVAALILFFLWSLGFITKHGAFEKVPSVAGKSLTEATKILEAKGFRIEVQDSLYVDGTAPFAILRQSPEADMLVKTNRTIYLTINRSQPPLVEMPNMVGFSFRNAEMYLKQLGLKLGDTTRKPDIAKDAVLSQMYNGQEIKAGTQIFMGSTVSFVLGSGLGDDEFDVPNIVGMKYAEAVLALRAMNLNPGSVIADGVKDTLNGYVYKQIPAITTTVRNLNDTTQTYTQKNKIREGQSIDLFIGLNKVELPPVDSTVTE